MSGLLHVTYGCDVDELTGAVCDAEIGVTIEAELGAEGALVLLDLEGWLIAGEDTHACPVHAWRFGRAGAAE